MSKKNLAKRIIALVAIVTVFAAMTITASAASYSSTTMYLGDDTVEVKTVVTGLTNGDQVTYYAKNGADPVYVNQYTVNGTRLEKSYKADIADVADLTIKMAKVNSSFASGSFEKSDVANDYDNFSFVLDGDVVWSDDTAPAEEEIIETDIPAVDDGKKISNITATYNGASENVVTFVVDGYVSIVNPFDFSDAVGMVGVDLTATYGYAYDGSDVDFDYVGRYIGENEDGTIISVLYGATIPVDATEVGIKVTMVNGEKISAEYLDAIGVLGSTNPQFAIALVEEGLESFGYTPYCIVDGNEVLGTYKTVNTIE